MAVSKTIIHPNLTAYEGYEIFNDTDKAEVYMRTKINSALPCIQFIQNHFPILSRPRVLELGAGNSKTLFALESWGILEAGYGLEISEDRHKFAEHWKTEKGFSRVTNIQADFNETDFKRFGDLDLILCTDLAFQFSEPLKDGNDGRLLSKCFNSIVPGGFIMLELDGCDRIIDGDTGNKKIWEEFNEPDPWRFSLWDCDYDSNKKFLKWKKKFIKRDLSQISESEITLRIYKHEEIMAKLKMAGFDSVTFYLSGWDYRHCTGQWINDKGEFIVVARKPK